MGDSPAHDCCRKSGICAVPGSFVGLLGVLEVRRSKTMLGQEVEVLGGLAATPQTLGGRNGRPL